MSELADEALAAARRNRASLAGAKLTPATAKLYSQHFRLAAGGAPLATFSEGEFVRRLTDAVVLVDGSLQGRVAGDDDWRDGLRRAAEILEWLAHPDLDKGGIPLSLLSAAAYHLAGFPARATTLASRPGADEQEAPLLRLLLRAEFSTLLYTAVEVAANPSDALTAYDEGASALEIEDFIAREVASALGIVVAGLRWGRQRRVTQAVAKLRAAATAVIPFADPYAWLALRLVAEVADQALGQSLRGLVRPLRDTVDEDGRTALERYVRATYASGRILAWPSQARGLDRLAAGGSFALCTPTGSGKTTVAEIALLAGLFSTDARPDDAPALCLYLVPTRALAAEVENRLSRSLRGMGGRQAIAVTGLYGGTDWGPTDVWLSASSPTVLVCTQEKAEALVRYFGARVVERIRLVVVDEAHEVQERPTSGDSDPNESRALRLETLIARLRARLGTEARFVALSAVARGIQIPLARWISGDADRDPIVIPYRSTRQVIGRLRCLQGGRTRVELDLLDGQSLELTDREEGPFIPAPFEPFPSTAGMEGSQKGLAPYALWAAMQLADGRREASGQTVLISIAQGIGHWANWLNQILDEWSDSNLPHFFDAPSEPNDLALFERALESCADYFGEESREYRLLVRGVVVHHGRMPGRLPRVLIELVERRIVRIVVATSTLSQGVNLPFETVLIPGLRRHNGRMSGRELNNLAGRAGRPGVSTEGQTLVLLNETSEGWQRRASSSEYLEALAEITGTQPDEGPASAFAALIAEVERLGPEGMALDAWLETTAPLDVDPAAENDDAVEALDSLDAVLLACLEEADATSPTEAEEALRRVWRETFARYAAAAEADMERTVIKRASAVSRIYRSGEQRTRIYRTGLPARDARRLELMLPAMLKHLETGEHFAEWDRRQRFAYVQTAVELISSVQRFAVPANVGRAKTTWRQALQWWLDRDEADVEPKPTQIAQWHDFIGTYFAYRFNWALAGILSSLLVEVEGTQAPLDVWANSTLPWAAWWLKDLMTWGTLDPVAAYLLARGGFDSRREAEAEARGYWEEERDEPLNPLLIREWVSARETVAPSRRVQPPRRLAAKLAVSFSRDQAERPWRVLPLMRGDAIDWVDPAGIVLARSEPTDTWHADFASEVDFLLRPKEKRVTARQYV